MAAFPVGVNRGEYSKYRDLSLYGIWSVKLSPSKVGCRNDSKMETEIGLAMGTRFGVYVVEIKFSRCWSCFALMRLPINRDGSPSRAEPYILDDV